MKPTLRIFLILLIVLLASALVYLLLNNNPSDIQFDIITQSEDYKIGIYGPVGLQFDQPMDQTSVENHIAFSPRVSGRFEWVENTVWFYPDEPLDASQGLTLSFSPGAKSADGQTLNSSMEWTVSIRPMQVLYLVLDQTGGDLWRWDFTTQAAIPVTATGGKIIDFAPTRTGEAIVYAAENAEGGSDLWFTNRTGDQNNKIVDCGLDYCSEPVWSVDGVLIAYARQTANPTTGLLQSPRIWLYDSQTLENEPLYPDRNIAGELPSFSPNGEWLAFYDLSESALRVLNLATTQETLIPTAVEAMGDWSADGNLLLFTDLVPSALEPEIALYIADLENKTITQTLTEDSDGTIFSQPKFTPDGEWIAVSLRAVNSTGNKALWVLKLDGSEINLVANQQNANYTSYQWNPSGQLLVYQQFNSGGPSFQSSIWLWNWRTDESQLLIENGSRPVWLP